MRVRTFSPDDIAFAAQLARLEGWNNTATDYENLLRFEPQGCFIAEEAGAPVGIITTITYGKLGWIGSLIVGSAHRGRGFGRALLEIAMGYLFDRGVRTIGLDATPPAASLYASVGFWRAFDTLHLWREPLPVPSPVADSLVPLEARDLHAVTMFDWAPFGGRRRRVLQALRQISPVAYLAQDQAGLGGYLMARRSERCWIIGPWVCVRSAEPLLTAALAAIGPQPLWIGVPEVNKEALQLLQKHGFTLCQRRMRMYYGDEEGIGQPQRIYAVASPEKG